MLRKRPRRFTTLIVALIVSALALTGCAGMSMTGEEFSRAINGVTGTMSTYNEESQVIDRVDGVSFRFARDDRFDTHNSEGSNKDSAVVMISLGDSHIFHVGSTMIFAQDGIVNVAGQLPDEVRFSDTVTGTPWLNDIRERFGNLWQGKAKTTMVRSQNGTPLAVFAGNAVETFATDIPKSTAFRVDGKYLLVYRADYTVYDNTLLQRAR